METVPDHDLEPPDIDLLDDDIEDDEDVAPDGRDWMDWIKDKEAHS